MILPKNVKVFANIVEEAAVEQINDMATYKPYVNSKIRIMPDVHAGKGCVIGTTMTLLDKVTPNLVGVDIGCGMLCVKIKNKDCEKELEKLDAIIHQHIPSGICVRSECDDAPYKEYVEPLRMFGYINDSAKQRISLSMGTLGGGNHFIELNKDDKGNYYLVIHTGSRNLGVQVCNYYQTLAAHNLRQKIYNIKDELMALIHKLKSEGRQQEIAEQRAKLLNKRKEVIVDESLAYLEGADFDDYLHDMRLVQLWADENRQTIANVIISHMNWEVDESFTTVHNYIDIDNMILRKGAVSANTNEKLIIPMNMRDGSLICIGKGNKDWNRSAPHGAGRIMSRTEARNRITMDDFRESMKDIYSTTVNMATIDEAPMAYKPIYEIVANIRPTVDVVDIIKPVYNFKATE